MAALMAAGNTMDPLTQQLIDRAWNAEKLRRQKAAIQRTVTTLRKQSRELGALLDDDERARLDDAARILDRWTGKAERAFRAKHQAEQQEHRRQEQRRHHALAALPARYQGASLDAQIRYACALVQLDDYARDLPGALREEMRWIDNNTRACPGMDPGRRLGNFVRDRLRDAMRSVVDTIACRTEPLADLLQQVFEKIDDAIARDAAETARLIAEVRVFLVGHQIRQANWEPLQSN